MAKEESENILGWYNDEEVVLCAECFAKKHQHHDVNWTPIREEDQREDMDVCDECEKKL